MARDISIAISAKDNFTQAITTMRNANQAFNKDLDGLSSKLSALSKTKTTLQIDATRAKKELQEAQKAFRLMNDEAADDTALRKATENYENIRRNLKLVSDEARSTEKAIAILTDAHSKAENRVQKSGGGNSSGMGGIGSDTGDGILKSLSQAGLTQILGDAASNALGAGIGSVFGGTTGNAIGSVLSGVASGAAMGSVAGPMGTLAGAGIGLVAGGLNAGTQIFQAQDDAFKGYVQNAVQSQLDRQRSDTMAGSAIASGREDSLVAFSTLFGDQKTAENYLEEMKTMANSTPFLYDDLAQLSMVLKTYGYKAEEMIPQLTTIGDAGASLGMGVADMGEVAKTLGMMRSSGRVTKEDVDKLQGRGIDVYGYLGEALGISNGAVLERISKGMVDGAKAEQIIIEALNRDFGGGMETLSQTFSGLSSTLQGWQMEKQNARGEGYNEKRKEGIKEEIAYLETGIYEKTEYLIGAWEAEQQNIRDRMLREAEKAAYEQIEQQGLNEVEAGKLLAEARIKAEAEYNASEGAQLMLESQKSLIENVRNTLAEDHTYWDAGYVLGEEFTKGLAAAVSDKAGAALSGHFDSYRTDNEKYDGLSAADRAMASQYEWDKHFNEIHYGVPGAAYGIPYVPRDNYPVRLHEGERVLTAQEARQRTGVSGISVQIQGDLVVREQADVDQIAETLLTKINQEMMIT